MPDRKPPRGSAKREPPQANQAADHSPKGTPTDDRHTTETAGGQHEHDQPHTTGHPAKGKRDQS